MELCVLLAAQAAQLGHQFLIVLLLLMVAVPSMLAFFTVRQHEQRKHYDAQAERMRMQAENDQLRAALDAAREETERIGRQLHDGVGHYVTLLSTELHLIKEYPEEFNPEVAAKLCEDIKLIREEIRNTSHNYAGHNFKMFGLVKAIQKEIERVRKTSNLTVELTVNKYHEGSLTHKNTEHLYYIFLESVQNVQKHAGASHLKVSLSGQGQNVVLTVSDDGCGFQPEHTNGMGLNNIRFRSILSEGTAAVEATPGKGTTVTINLPKYA